MEYNHAEAFCHMKYVDKTGRYSYSIWNSRDGVTPFNYPINGIECTHTGWRQDERNPEYKLRVGDLYFRDKTKQEADIEADRRIESFRGTPYEIKEADEDYKETFESISESYLQIPVLDIYY